MLTIRKAADRGVTRVDWLDSRHTFSFGDYFDPLHHHYRSLRVINDDRIAPGGGFGMHPHRDMEIVTYVFRGTLQHADSMGHGEALRAGEWQAMTAGSGLYHSEHNPSGTEEVHLLQIWIMPDCKGLTPTYRQTSFPVEGRQGKWQLAVSSDGAEGSLTIHQDARIYAARLSDGEVATHCLASGRGAYVHVATGAAIVNGQRLEAGDAVAIENEPTVEAKGIEAGEVLLFDLK